MLDELTMNLVSPLGAGDLPAGAGLHGQRLADGEADPLGQEAGGRLSGRRLVRQVFFLHATFIPPYGSAAIK